MHYYSHIWRCLTQDKGIHQLLQHTYTQPWRHCECLQAVESSKYPVPYMCSGEEENINHLMIVKSSDYASYMHGWALITIILKNV